MLRGNLSTNTLEYYDGTAWIRQVQRRTTFTPVLTFGGGSTGITYANQTGVYQIIGNTVWFELQIVLTNKGSSTGTALISLPFNGVVLQSPCSITCSNLTFSGTLCGNATTTGGVQLIQLTSGAALSALNDTNFANNSTVRAQGQYSIDPP